MKHPRLNQKKILIVVAHPDDESLYFSGGLQKLSKFSQVTVLCATYARESRRGLELQATCQSLNLKCDFLGLEDSGIQSSLPCFEEQLRNYVIQNQFDLLITHPPHGGEKPHPHHLQTLLTVLVVSSKRKLGFAFFSESEVSFCQPQKSSSVMKLRLWPLISLYVFQTFVDLNWKSKWNWARLLLKHFTKVMRDLIAENSFFVRLEIMPCLESKAMLLRNYVSQKSVLQTYRTSTSGEEYLFLMTRFTKKSASRKYQNQEIMKSYHDFKNSTVFWTGPH